MISASLPTLPATSTACSVATARAASSARRLKAACAPSASETVPTRNATTAIVRRETGSLLTFITGQILVVAKDALAWSRRSFLGFWGLRDCVVVVSLNCDQFAAPQQTNP